MFCVLVIVRQDGLTVQVTAELYGAVFGAFSTREYAHKVERNRFDIVKKLRKDEKINYLLGKSPSR